MPAARSAARPAFRRLRARLVWRPNTPAAAQREGFTLIELIVAIVLIGLLAALAVPAFRAVTGRVHDRVALAEMAAVSRHAAALVSLDGATSVGFSEEALAASLAGAPEALAGEVVYRTERTAAGFALLEENTSSEAYGDVSWNIADDGEAIGLAMRSRSGRCAWVTGDRTGAVQEGVTDAPEDQCIRLADGSEGGGTEGGSDPTQPEDEEPLDDIDWPEVSDPDGVPEDDPTLSVPDEDHPFWGEILDRPAAGHEPPSEDDTATFASMTSFVHPAWPAPHRILLTQPDNGRVVMVRQNSNSSPAQVTVSTFAGGLNQPSGIAVGPDPSRPAGPGVLVLYPIYVGTADAGGSLVRIDADTRARTVVATGLGAAPSHLTGYSCLTPGGSKAPGWCMLATVGHQVQAINIDTGSRTVVASFVDDTNQPLDLNAVALHDGHLLATSDLGTMRLPLTATAGTTPTTFDVDHPATGSLALLPAAHRDGANARPGVWAADPASGLARVTSGSGDVPLPAVRHLHYHGNRDTLYSADSSCLYRTAWRSTATGGASANPTTQLLWCSGSGETAPPAPAWSVSTVVGDGNQSTVDGVGTGARINNLFDAHHTGGNTVWILDGASNTRWLRQLHLPTMEVTTLRSDLGWAVGLSRYNSSSFALSGDAGYVVAGGRIWYLGTGGVGARTTHYIPSEGTLTGLVPAAGGSLWTVNNTLNRVERISTAGELLGTVALPEGNYYDLFLTGGQLYAPSSSPQMTVHIDPTAGTAADTGIGRTNGLVVTNDAVYAADGHRLWQVDLDAGERLWPMAGTATAGFADGIGSNALLDNPGYLFTAGGVVHVFDRGNGAVRRMAEGRPPAGGGFDYTVTPAPAVSVNAPADVVTAYDLTSELSGDITQAVYTSQGVYLPTSASNTRWLYRLDPATGQVELLRSNIGWAVGLARYNTSDIAVVGGTSVYGLAGGQVWRFPLDTNERLSVFGLPSGNSAATLAAGPDGTLWTVDNTDNTLVQFDPATSGTRTLRTIALPASSYSHLHIHGTTAYLVGSSGTLFRVNLVTGASVDTGQTGYIHVHATPAGTYATSSSRVWRIDPITGRRLEPLAGADATGARDGIGTTAQLQPRVLFSHGTALYTGDSSNQVLRRLTSSSAFDYRVSAVPTVALGQPATVQTIVGSGANTLVDGTGTEAGLRNVTDIAQDGDTVWFIEQVSTNRTLRRLDVPTGEVTTVRSDLGWAVGLTRHAIGDLAVVGDNLYGVTSGAVYLVGTDNSTRAPIYSRASITGLAADPAGKLWTVDNTNNQLVQVDPATGWQELRTVGLPSSSYSHLRIRGTTAYLIGSSGRLFITDLATGATADTGEMGFTQLHITSTALYATGGHRVWLLDPTTGARAGELAGAATSGYADGVGDEARFNSPRALFTHDGRLHVFDAGNFRVRTLHTP